MVTSAFNRASGRAPVLPLQTLIPRARLVLRSLPLTESPSRRAALRHLFLALFFPIISPSLLLSSHSARQGFLHELHAEEETVRAWRGNVGGLPAHLNLARFLSNSCFSRWKS